MSLYSFFGCLFLAYGPILSIFFLYIARNAQYVLLMVSSVAIQEIFRWGFFRILSLSGFGYALMSCLVSYISLLVESLGPGVKMCQSCPGLSLFFVSAINTTIFSLLHMAWMMVAFEGFSSYKTKSGMLQITWVIFSHYGASYATLFNASDIHLGCVYSALIGVVILAISCAWIAYGLKSRNYINRHTN
ncbi:Aph-1 protein-domain-containing protein [Phycomyces blakesleeanus]|uniref:Aph-1 protein-domain-containing protein n=1 Tax=Phycomyces blakesleeanus TaxID=4837 RepID=A0ABR3B8R3_PHYBL